MEVEKALLDSLEVEARVEEEREGRAEIADLSILNGLDPCD